MAGLPSSPAAEDLYDAAPCGLLVTARDGTVLRANRTFCDWVGLDAASLVGTRKLQELFTMGGRIFHQTHWAPLLQIQGSIAEVKFDVRRADGRTVPMVFNAVRREHAGEVRHEVAAFIAQDRHQYERELLAQRRRAEDLLGDARQAQQALAMAQERLRLALDAARLFVWDQAAGTDVPRYEDRVALLLGHAAPRPVSHAELTERVHPDDRSHPGVVEAMPGDATRGGYAAVFRLSGVDGRTRTVQATGRGFFDAAGRLEHVVGVLHDVSDLVRQRAEAEDRALFAEQMIGIVSHDLRNPLSAIRTSAELLRRLDPSPKQLRVVDLLSSSTRRAARMIDDLLDFTQARLGRRLAAHLADVDLHAAVGDAVAELRLAFPDQRLDHVREGPAGPCAVDVDRLVQAVGNLVANAVSHGDRHGTITVTSRQADGRCLVAVHNTGTPIPPAQLPTLFEAATRGTAAGSNLRSVGLGLFIVREIARAHGGTVDVVSSAEAGTRFAVRFPARADGAPAGA